jgi:hypothetical protein
MKLGIMQPYFLPYIGYWQLMNAVDKYVIYDDVNYIKGGYVNRNTFLINGESKMCGISVKNVSHNRTFLEHWFTGDFRKFLQTIRFNYSKSPYFFEAFDLLETICSYNNLNVADFLENQIKLIAAYCDIHTEFVRSSNMIKNNNLSGEEKIININNLLGADTYINAIGGMKLYHSNKFSSNGISLQFLQAKITPYKQFRKEFIPKLSILDILMFCSKEQISHMLNDYDLLSNSVQMSE